ncbi:MAG: SIS domain-containing protein [Clostridia bacterium]|nr:SIS domain-containing protein [Clostridia bacterium]
MIGMIKMNDLFRRYPELSVCRESLEKAVEMMCETYYNGGKILVCGNGGSCADSEHIVGELMKSFTLARKIPDEDREKLFSLLGDESKLFVENLQRGIPAFSLCSQSGVMTAYNNDVNPDMVYAQLLYACGKKEDLLIGISTSGNSKNVVNAVKAAKAFGIKSLCLTGAKECMLDDFADCIIKVPETETYKIQELHLPVYHYLCLETEKKLFG